MQESLSNIIKVASHWSVQVFAVISCALFVAFLQKRIIARVRKRLEAKQHLWASSVIRALKGPISLFIWILGGAFACQIIEDKTGAFIFSAIPMLRDVAIIGTIGWFFLRFIEIAKRNLLSTYAQKGRKVDVTTADAITKILKTSVIVTSGLIAVQTLGFSISGVWALGGVGGIAVGFAAKDLLANFFGGLMIYWDRPFSVGDWIRSADREIEGTVEHIGWRLSCIRTFDKRPLYIPNSIFASIAVENPSRMTHRRIYETIGMRYDDAPKVEVVLSEIRQMLTEHPEIDESQTLMVNLNTCGTSSLDFFIYTFTHTTVWTRFHEIKEEILLKIHGIIVSHGAQVAFPTSTIHLSESNQHAMEAEASLLHRSSMPPKVIQEQKPPKLQ